ncbi:MAG: hypothetical protein IPN68_08860 [Bacteroidetes bacterium]|nr:hypothetical protein [Bacteroidota bacterium]
MNLLEKEKTDTGRIVLSYRLAYELQYTDPEKSEQIAIKAWDEAEKLNFPKVLEIQWYNLETLNSLKETMIKHPNYILMPWRY